MSADDLFQEAITAVKAGHRSQGRDLLIQLVEETPHHELAWLWLSELVDSPEDKIIALENALTINPNRPKARIQLEKLRREHPPQPIVQPAADPIIDKWEEALNAIHIGLERKARRLLQEIVAEQPNHPQAWWQLSLLLESPEERIVALEHLLKVDPHHEKGKEILSQLQMNQRDALALGKAYEAQGDFQKAAAAYKAAMGYAPTTADKLIAKKRLAEVEHHLQQDNLKKVSPVFTFVRLVAGPPILYTLLLLLHAGLNPLQISLLLYLGGVVVCLGSILSVTAQYAPPLPILQRLVGPVETRTPIKTTLLGSVGFVVMVTPFVLFFWSAMNRLELYRPIFWQNFTP